MKPKLEKPSKLLSLVLRHDPGAIGIELDEQGWVGVEELLEAIRHSGRPAVSREELEEVVTTNDKKRFSFNDDGTRIRANQGHSLEVDLGLEATAPPRHLFHGTATRFLNSILADGLIPGQRQHVHLSADEVTAQTVGSRHGKPVILVIDCAAMAAAGCVFYLSANRVWLIEKVAPEFLVVKNV